MDIVVTGRRMEITPAIRQYASDKVAKLPRYFDRVMEINVLAGRQDSHSHEVEIIVKAEHAEPFVAKDSGPDLYACIDRVVDKLERQLTDHKSRVRDRKHSVQPAPGRVPRGPRA